MRWRIALFDFTAVGSQKSVEMSVLIFVLFFLVFTHGAKIPPKSCPLEKNCGKVNEGSAICGLDEELGCIRKYPSKCHLDIAACHQGKEFKDYSDLYCSMEAYFCVKSSNYDRWTIFFGHEDD